MSENDQIVKQEGLDSSIKSDLIFIDGLHTFEQSFQDFKNSLMFSHENTIWIIDDTAPYDPYSAVPDQEKADYCKSLAGIIDLSWQGDVYKTIFAIHDYYPDFSYCTIQEHNKQTVLWRKPGGNRKPVFSSLEEIKNQTFFDLVDKVELLGLVSFEQAMAMMGKEIAPIKGAPLPDLQKLLIGPIYNLPFVDNIRIKDAITSYNDSIQKKMNELENIIKLLEMEVSQLKSKNHNLETKIKSYES